MSSPEQSHCGEASCNHHSRFTQIHSACAHLQPSLGSPGEAQAVGQDSGRDSGPVVAAPAHEHYTQAGHMPLRAERHLRGAGAHLDPNREVSVRR